MPVPKLKAAAIAASSSLTLLLGACAGDPSANGEAASDSLVVNMNIAPTSLDPAFSCSTDDASLAMSTYVQLVQYGTKQDAGVDAADQSAIKPYFASDWAVSKDGLTYTFDLPEGWDFPSGEPMDAEAVKYSFDRITALGSCAYTIINFLYVDPDLIADVEAPDAQTVVFTLSHPEPNFLTGLASPWASIVDPSLVEANGGVVPGKPNDWMASHDAGSGPFRLESYEPGTRAVLLRDDGFDGEAAASEKVTVNFVKSEPNLLLAAKDGSADVTYGLSRNSVNTLSDNDQVTAVANSGTANMQLLMPNDKAPWTDPKVREAVTYAIPYDDIIDKVLYGFGTTYYGPIPPGFAGYDEAASDPRTYDVERAKSLLEEAGVDLPLKLTLDVLASDTTQVAIATTLQSSLKEIGLEIAVNKLSESAWADTVYGGASQMSMRLDGPALPDAGFYLQYDSDCASEHNYTSTCIEANTDLLNQARGSNDPDEQAALYAQITRNWITESPKAVLYLDQKPVVVASDLDYYFSPFVDMRTWKKG